MLVHRSACMYVNEIYYILFIAYMCTTTVEYYLMCIYKEKIVTDSLSLDHWFHPIGVEANILNYIGLVFPDTCYDWGRKVLPDIWLRQKGPPRYFTEAERSSQMYYWGRKVLPDIWLRQTGPPRHVTEAKGSSQIYDWGRNVLPGIWLRQKGPPRYFTEAERSSQTYDWGR